MGRPNLWQTVRSLVQQVRSIADDITVPVVANLKTSTLVKDDYEGTSVTTEYFSESEVSQVLLGLNENGFYTKLYPGERDFIEAVLHGSFEKLPRPRKLVYNAARSGTGPGRKSLVPAFCAFESIAVCNSDSYVVSLARNKFHVQGILRSLGIPVPESWLFDAKQGWLLGKKPPESTGLIAKPSYESSSIGLSNASIGRISAEYEHFLRRTSDALRQPLIVQQFIPGLEVEVPIIDFGSGPLALGPISITLQGQAELGHRILDYEIVERDGYGFDVPNSLASNTIMRIRAAAIAAFSAIGIRALGRVDFRVSSADGPFYVTDIATSPYLVQHSSFAFSFRRENLGHADLMGALVAANAKRYGWI